MLNLLAIIMGFLNVGMVATFIAVADRVSNWWVAGFVVVIGLAAQLLLDRAISNESVIADDLLTDKTLNHD